MGKFILFAGLIIVLIFLYYLFTNAAFMAFVTSALNFGTAVVQSSAVSQFVNTTKGMNESSFLSWANSEANSNPLIARVRAASASVNLQSNLESIWGELKKVDNSNTLNSLRSLFERIISNGTAN